MNEIVFNQVVASFNNGQVNFNLGYKWSFLYNQKWYPVHAFMAEYNAIMGIGNEMNLHASVFTLSKFIPTATAEIDFVNHLPKSII